MTLTAGGPPTAASPMSNAIAGSLNKAAGDLPEVDAVAVATPSGVNVLTAGTVPAPADASPFRRDGRGTPQVRQPDGTDRPYYRASSVSSLIEDKTGVHTWEINNQMFAAAHDPGLHLSLLGLDDVDSAASKTRMRELRRQGEHASGMTRKREAGTALHGLLTRVDRGLPLPATLDAAHLPTLEAYRKVIARFEVLAIELPIVCDELEIAGTLDKLVSPRHPMVPRNRRGEQFAPTVEPGQVVVADVKTSSDSKYFGVGFASQMAPYARSVAYVEVDDPSTAARQEADGVEMWTTGARTERLGEARRTPHGARTDVGLLIHAPLGTPGEVTLWWFDLTAGWEAATHAMGTRALRARSRQMCAPAELPAEPIPAPPAPVLDYCAHAQPACPACAPDGNPQRPALIELDEGAHLLTCLVEALDIETLDALWNAHGETGDLWTAEHTSAAQQRYDELTRSTVAAAGARDSA